MLVLTMHDDDASVFAAIRAPIRGYLLKGAGQDDVARAIAAVSRGEAILGLPWRDVFSSSSAPGVRNRPHRRSPNSLPASGRSST